MQAFFTETFFADSTIIYDIEFEGIQVIVYFSTVRDALSSSILLITLGIITLYCGRDFWIKDLRLKILSSTTREDSFTQLFVPTCKITV